MRRKKLALIALIPLVLLIGVASAVVIGPWAEIFRGDYNVLETKATWTECHINLKDKLYGAETFDMPWKAQEIEVTTFADVYVWFQEAGSTPEGLKSWKVTIYYDKNRNGELDGDVDIWIGEIDALGEKIGPFTVTGGLSYWFLFKAEGQAVDYIGAGGKTGSIIIEAYVGTTSTG